MQLPKSELNFQKVIKISEVIVLMTLGLPNPSVSNDEVPVFISILLHPVMFISWHL